MSSSYARLSFMSVTSTGGSLIILAMEVARLLALFKSCPSFPVDQGI